jgi:predicted acetyltransferase
MGTIGMPVGQLSQLAVLPEYRDNGLDSLLLRVAESSVQREHGVWALMGTKWPRIFRPWGWGSYLPFSMSTAGLRELLRELTQQPPVRQRNVLSPTIPPTLEVRPWRQIELSNLQSLYDAELGEKVFGTWQRSEAQWRWLIERRGYDRIYIATQSTGDKKGEKIVKRGRPKTESDVIRPANVVAYAVQRGDHVLELAARDGNAAFSRPLLARICADALEVGYHELTFHAQPDDPVHAWFNAAGRATQQLESFEGQYLMAKVLDTDRFMQLLLPVLSPRIKPKISEKWQLGIHLGNRRVVLQRGSRRLQLVPNAKVRNYVEMSPQTFLSLACGQLDPRQAMAAGALNSSTKLAQERVASLFCRVPFVWSAWDA